MVSLTTLAFWKRKESEENHGSERIIPLPPLPTPNLEQVYSASEIDVNGAKQALKVLLLERQIIGSALTTIFETETKGIISQAERDQLVKKYTADLHELEQAIQKHQRIVDLYELENSREQLIKDFNTRITEIDGKIGSLRNGDSNVQQNPLENALIATPTVSQEVERPVTQVEKRVELIRDEILKAMERLEQIESEE